MVTVRIGRLGVGGLVSVDEHQEMNDLRLGKSGDFPSLMGRNPVRLGRVCVNRAFFARQRMKER